MVVLMKADAQANEVQDVCRAARDLGMVPHEIRGPRRAAVAVTGNGHVTPIDEQRFQSLPGVEKVVRVTREYRLASREMQPHTSTIKVGRLDLGGPAVVVIAGPCAVESQAGLLTLAAALKQRGAHMLRGGAFKPRTSPYSFQGLGPAGLEILAQARAQTGLPVVSEVLAVEDVPLVEEHVDVIQIGARNMYNYPLLNRVGSCSKPVLLKRGMAATLEEFLLSAEYIMAQGNSQIILCERGIRTFDDHVRFTLDLSSVPQLRAMTHLPIVVDPSHAAGRRELVPALARAAVAAGADAVMLEVHDQPALALSDAAQSLTLEMLDELMRQLPGIAQAIGRQLAPPV